MLPFYQQEIKPVLEYFKSSASGLSSSAVQALRQQYGPNALTEAKRKTKWAILISQFTDVMIIILLVAAIVSFVVGEHTDALVILAIIIGNAWLGFSQENNAEKSMRMLQKMSAQHATVIRDKKPLKIGANEIVPGDIIMIEAGDIVPADARIIETAALKTDESSLTGESHAMEKIMAPVKGDGLVPGDQKNMLFKGTIVSNGSAKAVVTATGMHTELGKIAGLMNLPEQKTPLQKRLATFSKQLTVIVVVICAALFGIGLLRGMPPFEMFLTALSLAVAALPEALPAVITIALAQGASRLVKQKALMRKLPAVETLGSVTYICSDKTGTLTQNVMTVEKVDAADGKEELLHHAMILNNEVKFSDEGLLGDPTETAMATYATDKDGFSLENSQQKFPEVAKLPFDSERMRMSTLHKDGDKYILLVKGAPAKMAEVYAERYHDALPGWIDQNKEWAKEGLRVLFFGYKEMQLQPDKLSENDENDLHYLGMIAMIDPPREEVVDAIKECKTAGIKSVMITGDQPLTARAIALRLGMVEGETAEVKTGAMLQKLSAEELQQEVKDTVVYARVTPEQKLNIVKALQQNAQFVAMTGDGVNDAPSLKQADIGVAMGITGTDVSKEAADMVLMDDNFATLVKAVKEGRRIYDNIRKFILYVLSCNLAEILTIFFAPIIGFGMPLLPIHILWINLVTDGLPGLALVAEPAEKNIMQIPPRPPKENLFAGGLVFRIISSGIVLAAAALAVQWWGRQQGFDLRMQQTMVFTTLCIIQLGNALSVRSAQQFFINKSFFANKLLWLAILLTLLLQALIIYIPGIEHIFKTVALPMQAVIDIVLLSAVSLLIVDLMKLGQHWWQKRNRANL